jgi:hypothetical protein
VVDRQPDGVAGAPPQPPACNRQGRRGGRTARQIQRLKEEDGEDEVGGGWAADEDEVMT